MAIARITGTETGVNMHTIFKSKHFKIVESQEDDDMDPIYQVLSAFDEKVLMGNIFWAIKSQDISFVSAPNVFWEEDALKHLAEFMGKCDHDGRYKGS